MVNARQKGKVGEELVKSFLEEHTPYKFERTPGSGNGNIKGDIYIPKYNNVYCIEVKNHAESPLSDKIFTNKTNKLAEWWPKLLKDCAGKKPLLFYRYNRSKLFVVTDEKPQHVEKYIDISWLKCYIMLSDDWIKKENIKWLNLPPQ